MSDPLRPATRWPTLVLVVLVFLSGAAVGGGGTAIWIGQHLQTPDDQVDLLVSARLEETLDLSPDESRRVRPVLRRRGARLRAIREDADRLRDRELEDLSAELGDAIRPEKAERLRKRIGELTRKLRGRRPR